MSPLVPLPKLSSAKTPRKTQTQKQISSWAWAIFIGSLLIFLSVVFFVSWSSSGPTFLSSYLVNPSPDRPLPGFLKPPTVSVDLLLPIISTLLLCLLLRWVPPTNTTRLIVKSILILLAIRYLLWRTFATLNLAHWTSASLSLFLYVNECLCFVSFFLFTVHTIRTNSAQRSAQADRYSEDVIAGEYLPWVDVFIPTYNEPEAMVRRTAIGCQAMDYPNKRIYILDDTRRPHIRQLAKDLGCRYITRPDNTHAKAGNLNHALEKTSGEFIALFDADFVPFRIFLTRTVGFFQQPHITLVQTKQNFYNPDYHSRNLGVEHVLPNDQESFYGYIQPCWDVANSVICCGTSYVVRRKDLESVGGYYTRCCVEDLQTSFLMRTRGLRLIFLNETLSMGESTRTYADFIDQRLRWLQGNLQIHFCLDEVPIWAKLNWVQKSYVLSHLLCCFSPIFRLGFLLAPLISAYLGVLPYLATLSEVCYYFVPFILLNFTVGGWTSGYRTSSFWNEVYDTVFCFPGLRRLWLVLCNPFAKASGVTRKGVKAETKNYNFRLTWPLLLLLGLTIGIMAVYLVGYFQGQWLTMPLGSGVTFFWLIYNGVLMAVAVLSAIDQPVRRTSDRFPVRTPCKVTVGDTSYWGVTNNLSDTGVYLTLTSDRPVDLHQSDLYQPATLELLEHDFAVNAEIVRVRSNASSSTLALRFTNVTIEQSRHLVPLLYSDMTWWKQGNRPGGLDALLAMLASVVKLRPVLNRYDA